MDIDISFVIQYNYFVIALLKVNYILLKGFYLKKEKIQKSFHLRSNCLAGGQSP